MAGAPAEAETAAVDDATGTRVAPPALAETVAGCLEPRGTRPEAARHAGREAAGSAPGSKVVGDRVADSVEDTGSADRVGVPADADRVGADRADAKVVGEQGGETAETAAAVSTR